MKKILYIIIGIMCLGCSHKEQSSNTPVEHPVCNTLDEGYPDTIIVAFTRNGKLEDSVEAIREGLLKDSTGKYYSPAYVFRASVGDTWVYDVNGKFINFHESSLPHSGKPHYYKP